MTHSFFNPSDPNPSWQPGDKIHYGGRVYDESEIANAHQAAEEFWLTPGHFVDEFEAGVAKYIGAKNALFVNSGSSANLIAVSALLSERLGERALKPGDEIITLAAGFPTTVFPIIQNGLIPVFIDVTLPNYNADISQLENALSPKSKAVIFAHTLGNPFDIAAVQRFCKAHNLWLIEDNCDAFGSEFSKFEGGGHRRKASPKKRAHLAI